MFCIMMSSSDKLYKDICNFIKSPPNDQPLLFEELALRTFEFQYDNVEIFQKFCAELSKSPETVHSISDIPFLPIEFFKTFPIHSKHHSVQKIFESSGTTGSIKSQHHVCDLSIYELSCEVAYQSNFGKIDTHCSIALLPSYEERNNASLIYMVDFLMNKGGRSQSRFYGNAIAQLKEDLIAFKEADVPVVLWGVTFALLELIEDWKVSLSNTTIIETGGMKGRGEELTRKALHQKIQQQIQPANICSEYGMTELLSQCYAIQAETFHHPHWMRIQIRDVQDPFSMLGENKTGGINIIDLANIYSCSFISTQDLGRINQQGFEVLGRYDNSDIRGCNLLFSA